MPTTVTIWCLAPGCVYRRAGAAMLAHGVPVLEQRLRNEVDSHMEDCPSVALWVRAVAETDRHAWRTDPRIYEV